MDNPLANGRAVEREFADRDAAKIWIIENQLGRRNLETYARTALVLRMEELVGKIQAEAKERQRGGQGGVLLPQRGGEANKKAGETDQKIAEAKEKQEASRAKPGQKIGDHQAVHPVGQPDKDPNDSSGRKAGRF